MEKGTKGKASEGNAARRRLGSLVSSDYERAPKARQKSPLFPVPGKGLRSFFVWSVALLSVALVLGGVFTALSGMGGSGSYEVVMDDNVVCSRKAVVSNGKASYPQGSGFMSESTVGWLECSPVLALGNVLGSRSKRRASDKGAVTEEMIVMSAGERLTVRALARESALDFLKDAALGEKCPQPTLISIDVAPLVLEMPRDFKGVGFFMQGCAGKPYKAFGRVLDGFGCFDCSNDDERLFRPKVPARALSTARDEEDFARAKARSEGFKGERADAKVRRDKRMEFARTAREMAEAEKPLPAVSQYSSKAEIAAYEKALRERNEARVKRDAETIKKAAQGPGR